MVLISVLSFHDKKPQTLFFQLTIIFSELYTLQPPYQGIKSLDIVNVVVKDKYRPVFPQGTDPYFEKLITSCWAHESQSRPSFADVIDFLWLIPEPNSKIPYLVLFEQLSAKAIALVAPYCSIADLYSCILVCNSWKHAIHAALNNPEKSNQSETPKQIQKNWQKPATADIHSSRTLQNNANIGTTPIIHLGRQRTATSDQNELSQLRETLEQSRQKRQHVERYQRRLSKYLSLRIQGQNDAPPALSQSPSTSDQDYSGSIEELAKTASADSFLKEETFSDTSTLLCVDSVLESDEQEYLPSPEAEDLTNDVLDEMQFLGDLQNTSAPLPEAPKVKPLPIFSKSSPVIPVSPSTPDPLPSISTPSIPISLKPNSLPLQLAFQTKGSLGSSGTPIPPPRPARLLPSKAHLEKHKSQTMRSPEKCEGKITSSLPTGGFVRPSNNPVPSPKNSTPSPLKNPAPHIIGDLTLRTRISKNAEPHPSLNQLLSSEEISLYKQKQIRSYEEQNRSK